jgi:proline iminopeptidase
MRFMLSRYVVPLIAFCAAQSNAGGAQQRGMGATEIARSPGSARVSEGYVMTPDRVRLFYRKLAQGKDVAVYVHGGPGANFRGQDTYIDQLAQGRTIVMYDQRGSGRSDVVTDPHRLTVEHMVSDLEAVRRHFGARRITLIGLSWGAALAALYTARHPDRVERLLLISPMAPSFAFDEQRNKALNALLSPEQLRRRRELRKRMAASSDAEAVAICREQIDITFGTQYVAHPTASKLEEAKRRCDIPPAAIRNRYVVEAAVFDEHGSLHNWDFRPMLSRFRVPTLVMEGTETAVPLDATRAWAAAIPNARLLLIPGAGHELFLDEPVLFVRAAREFLAGRLPAGAVRVAH